MAALRQFLAPDFVSDAARLLLDHPGRVLIVTGFYIQRAGAAETDGPPGAAALGAALGSLGWEVSYVTDRFSTRVVEAVVGDGLVIEFPVADDAASEAFARDLIARQQPSAIVAIERPGLLRDGTYRNFAGVEFTEFNAKTDYLFGAHAASVGIGDGGNEIGMGNLRDAIAATKGLPAGPCITTTDRLIIASCSNWGAYGLVTALSRMTGRNLLPSVERGYEWVQRAVEAGAVEGLTGEAKDWVDGRSPVQDAVCLRDLHDLLRREGLSPGTR